MHAYVQTRIQTRGTLERVELLSRSRHASMHARAYTHIQMYVLARMQALLSIAKHNWFVCSFCRAPANERAIAFDRAMALDSIQGRAWHAELDDARRASGQGMTVEAVEVRIGSESDTKIATLDIKANDLVKHVKEQLETKTGIDHAVMRLSHRFHSGRVD